MASLRKRTYKVTLPSGKVETRRCKHYTIEYAVNGRRRSAKGYVDKVASRQLAARLERAAALGQEGLIDVYADQMARPLSEHVREYVAELRATGKDDKYRYVVEHRLNIVFEGCRWASLKDIEPNSFIRWRERGIQEHVRRGRLGKGMSATTATAYLECVRSFTNWCAEMKRLPGVPVTRRGAHGRGMMATALAGVSKVEGEKRRTRRALSDEQVAALLGVAGDRAIVYRVAMGIGLRRAELEALMWGDVRLNSIPAYVQLRAEATKARRGDRLDLPQSLATDLRALRPADARDNDPVFPEVPPIEQWKNDLAIAGIPYKDDMGRQADFHGLRKTLCSRMHRAGVPLAVAMKRMRHTDAKLTMIDYTDEQQIGVEAGILAEISPAKPATPTAENPKQAETA
jgi:integrase